MKNRTTKKLEDLNQKIETLKAEKEKIQQELEADFMAMLKKTEAFQIDFHTLIGGFLSLIEDIKKNPTQKKEWQETGRKFCKSRLPTKPAKTKTAPEPDQEAA